MGDCFASGSSFSAEDVFRIGPETLVAAASTVVAGPVAAYNKKILTRTAPPDSIALQWTVSGRIEQLQTLKGPPPTGSIQFSRSEHSLFLSPDESVLCWEESYGEIEPGDQIVVFLGEGEPRPILKTIPSRNGEGDLIALVKEIIRIQAIENLEVQVDAWLLYLNKSPMDEGRKVALRSLINSPVSWPLLEVALTQLLKNWSLSREIRGFAFGIVAFKITSGGWADAPVAGVDFLCRIFAAEPDPELALEYTSHLGVLLYYCNDVDFTTERAVLRKCVIDALIHRESLALPGTLADLELEGYYREIREEYIALEPRSKF